MLVPETRKLSLERETLLNLRAPEPHPGVEAKPTTVPTLQRTAGVSYQQPAGFALHL